MQIIERQALSPVFQRWTTKRCPCLWTGNVSQGTGLARRTAGQVACWRSFRPTHHLLLIIVIVTVIIVIVVSSVASSPSRTQKKNRLRKDTNSSGYSPFPTFLIFLRSACLMETRSTALIKASWEAALGFLLLAEFHINSSGWHSRSPGIPIYLPWSFFSSVTVW